MVLCFSLAAAGLTGCADGGKPTMTSAGTPSTTSLGPSAGTAPVRVLPVACESVPGTSRTTNLQAGDQGFPSP